MGIKQHLTIWLNDRHFSVSLKAVCSSIYFITICCFNVFKDDILTKIWKINNSDHRKTNMFLSDYLGEYESSIKSNLNWKCGSDLF